MLDRLPDQVGEQILLLLNNMTLDKIATINMMFFAHVGNHVMRDVSRRLGRFVSVAMIDKQLQTLLALPFNRMNDAPTMMDRAFFAAALFHLNNEQGFDAANVTVERLTEIAGRPITLAKNDRAYSQAFIDGCWHLRFLERNGDQLVEHRNLDLPANECWYHETGTLARVVYKTHGTTGRGRDAPALIMWFKSGRRASENYMDDGHCVRLVCWDETGKTVMKYSQ